MSLKKQICAWLRQDENRMQALRCLKDVIDEFSLQDCWIAAGFIRNLVWDKLHFFENSRLNDVDVIHYNTQTNYDFDKLIEKRLIELQPSVPWSVKNQSLMHIRNGDSQYSSSTDAMSYWPEIETAVAVRLADEIIEISSPFELYSLFRLHLTYNPKRSLLTFNERLHKKKWLKKYPNLKIVK